MRRRSKVIAIAAAVAMAGATAYVYAQTATNVAIVVSTCGTAGIFLAGRSAPLTVDTTGKVC